MFIQLTSRDGIKIHIMVNQIIAFHETENGTEIHMTNDEQYFVADTVRTVRSQVKKALGLSVRGAASEPVTAETE